MSTEQEQAMETVAGWAGSRPQREVLAALAMIEDAGNGFKAVRAYLEGHKRASTTPTLDDKWEWAFGFADGCIAYSRKHPPK